MDRSGRRRRLFTVLGAAVGVLLIAVGGLLIAGLLGSSPVPLPGLPNNGRGVLQRGDTDGDGLGTVPVPGTRTTTTRPRPPAGATTPAAAPTTDKPGNRPTSHPGNAKPSRTK
ncbi:MAG TPA: hypothetical protein VL738_12940 [Dactylosporangium sp.]|jgi:hypothetical protein|nr:hypothetical protein [Dactylosporangium sp.]